MRAPSKILTSPGEGLMLEGPQAGQLVRIQCRVVAESLHQLLLVLGAE